MTQNPAIGVGWKKAKSFQQLTQAPETECDGETGDKLIKCIEDYFDLYKNSCLFQSGFISKQSFCKTLVPLN